MAKKTECYVDSYHVLDRELTLSDAHGLAIMRELRLGCCRSTDRHLGLDGVPLAI